MSAARRRTVLALKLGVSLVLLAVLFSRIDVADLWADARRASTAWLAAAMLVYFVNLLVATWRWHLLLEAQDVDVPARRLLGSYLVATFFNNFLPSNIGGDVMRIGDTAGPARSKTLATTVVLADRGLGLLALILVAAIGATMAATGQAPAAPIWPGSLWAAFAVGVGGSLAIVRVPSAFGRLLRPLTVFHPEWVGTRIETLIGTLERFGRRFGALFGCFAGAVFVQATVVVFYFVVAYALHLGVAFSDLCVIVPISIVVQMLPVSVNGFGVREATFSFYFSRIGQPIAAGLLVSLVAQAVIILFSLTGAAVYVSRGHRRTAPMNAQVPNLTSEV